ncbi:MAG: hypothetical protein U5J63_08065 [Fodinibius sp.]|nr:hypothetical protein [Fodinibius sp.]
MNNSSVSILIRVDGGPQMRLRGMYIDVLLLPKCCRNYFEVTFIVKEIPEALAVKVRDTYGFILQNIDDEHAFFTMLEQTSEPSIVVLDGYQFDTDYQARVKEEGSKVVCVDDIHQTRFVADAVINHAPGISQSAYSIADDTKLYLGPDYALLREAFVRLARNFQVVQSLETAFVCFGGSDPHDFTAKTLRALSRLGER